MVKEEEVVAEETDSLAKSQPCKLGWGCFITRIGNYSELNSRVFRLVRLLSINVDLVKTDYYLEKIVLVFADVNKHINR